MNGMDPFALAARQMELDREAVKRLPWLAERKRQRLSLAPFTFLRGSAPLFYEMLRSRPDLSAGPAGAGFGVTFRALADALVQQVDSRCTGAALASFDAGAQSGCYSAFFACFGAATSRAGSALSNGFKADAAPAGWRG